MGICIDVGEAWDLKWCPLGGAEKGKDEMEVEEEEGERLGVLAGAFTDGSISFFVVPHPQAIRAEQETEEDDTAFSESNYWGGKRGVLMLVGIVHLQPVLRLALENTSFLSFDWNSHESIVAGCSNGSSLAWIRLPDSDALVDDRIDRGLLRGRCPPPRTHNW